MGSFLVMDATLGSFLVMDTTLESFFKPYDARVASITTFAAVMIGILWTISWLFSYNSFVKFHGLKIWEPHHDSVISKSVL